MDLLNEFMRGKISVTIGNSNTETYSILEYHTNIAIEDCINFVHTPVLPEVDGDNSNLIFDIT